jgi:cysteine-rich repeat protein
VLDEGEACDDANELAGDGCSDCAIEDGWTCTGLPSFCGPLCDPVLQDCADGSGCYPFDVYAWGCAPDASLDEGYQDGMCEFTNACDAGLVCLDPMYVPNCVSMAGCCTALCDVDDPACPSGMVCVQWYGDDDAPEGLEHVGACVGA